MEIRKELLAPENLKPLFKDATQLEFGKIYTDHMFTMEYRPGQGWTQAEIKPYQPLTLEPATMMFHYSQSVFEGQKAYRSPEDDILLFRPYENAKRLNRSLSRMGMPTMDEDLFVSAESELLKIEKRWIPCTKRGISLYTTGGFCHGTPFGSRQTVGELPVFHHAFAGGFFLQRRL